MISFHTPHISFSSGSKPDSLLLKQAEDARKMVAEQLRQDAKARVEWESAVKEALEGGWDAPPPPDDTEGMDGDLSFYEVFTFLICFAHLLNVQ